MNREAGKQGSAAPACTTAGDGSSTYSSSTAFLSQELLASPSYGAPSTAATSVPSNPSFLAPCPSEQSEELLVSAASTLSLAFDGLRSTTGVGF